VAVLPATLAGRAGRGRKGSLALPVVEITGLSVGFKVAAAATAVAARIGASIHATSEAGAVRNTALRKFGEGSTSGPVKILALQARFLG
jgi:hypothetical protein